LRREECPGESRSDRFMSRPHTAPGESISGTGGSRASRKSRSQEVEEIAGKGTGIKRLFPAKVQVSSQNFLPKTLPPWHQAIFSVFGSVDPHLLCGGEAGSQENGNGV
jgi:hypothetical protein